MLLRAGRWLVWDLLTWLPGIRQKRGRWYSTALHEYDVQTLEPVFLPLAQAFGFGSSGPQRRTAIVELKREDDKQYCKVEKLKKKGKGQAKEKKQSDR